MLCTLPQAQAWLLQQAGIHISANKCVTCNYSFGLLHEEAEKNWPKQEFKSQVSPAICARDYAQA